MKLLLDMNLPPCLAELITAQGIEAKHWHHIGAPDATDKEILEFALNNDFVLLTCDLDISAILSYTHGLKPSVIQLRTKEFKADSIIPLIVPILKNSSSELEQGAILTLDLIKMRVRLLPL
ncbi:MAG: DUF5615 family PIN-like protein [Clostridiales bacterium]|jgi:predicted nuclease of predicted toxin-antitoxin system|nr:DUF5615 family PIN-like protein [Clostridiales bacterium]